MKIPRPENVRVAIIENGQITGWREVPAWTLAPMAPEEWAKTDEGKKAFRVKLNEMERRGYAYDDSLYLVPRWSARSRKFFWNARFE